MDECFGGVCLAGMSNLILASYAHAFMQKRKKKRLELNFLPTCIHKLLNITKYLKSNFLVKTNILTNIFMQSMEQLKQDDKMG